MARKSTNLRNREFGYQLSGIEYKLIFKYDNIGFVRFNGQSKKQFYLDPSPFLDTPKSEIYILKSSPFPKKGELIEVSVFETDEFIYKSKGAYSKTIIKYVSSWEKLNPNKIIPRKTLEPYEFMDFFKQPFIGDKDYIKKMGCCLSLYAVSSPQISDEEKGGLNAAMLGKKKQWNAFKRIMDVIPNEFKSISSRNFYGLLDKEAILNPLKSAEVNLAYYNPPTMPVQIPVALDVETKSVSHYKANVEHSIPMVRAYILDTLLFQPEIPKKLDSHITNCVYDLIEEIKQSGHIPYNQDLGLAIPKLCSSFARLNFGGDATKENITESVNIWSDMFHHAKKTVSTQLPITKLYTLSGDARQLYIDLSDVFGVDVLIHKENIIKNSKLSKFKIDDALRELSRIGLILITNSQQIKLLDQK